MKRILCALCVSLLGWQALAGEVEDNLKKLETALQKTTKEQGKEAPDSEDSESPRRANLGYIMPSLRENISRNDLNSSIQMLQQFSAAPMLSAEARQACQELLASLLKEQETRDKAAAEKIDEALKHASEAVKKAKVPADLDAVLQELASVKNLSQTRRYTEETQANRNKVESTYRFVTKWQDFLAAQSIRDLESCRSILRDLTNQDTLLMPRSELLAKAQEFNVAIKKREANPEENPQESATSIEKEADELIAKANLGDEEKVLNELEKLVERGKKTGDGQIVSSLNDRKIEVGLIRRNYQAYKAGLATSINMETAIGSYGLRPPTSIFPLKQKLLLLVMPRYIGAPADVKPKQGEEVVDFLNRVMEEAKSKGDIALVIRAHKALNEMQRTSVWGNNDSTAFSKFQAAQNQEAAGQWMLAVVSYQETLKSGSDAVPAKFVGERLADIKKNHPEDYDKGMERFLNLPVPVSIDPSSRIFGRSSGMLPFSPTSEAPKLVIPPAPEKATPTPEPSPKK